jgi:hypothetical protein
MAEHHNGVISAAGLKYTEHLRSHQRIGDAHQLAKNVPRIR